MNPILRVLCWRHVWFVRWQWYFSETPDFQHVWWSDIYIPWQGSAISTRQNLLLESCKQQLVLNLPNNRLFIGKGQSGAFFFLALKGKKRTVYMISEAPAFSPLGVNQSATIMKATDSQMKSIGSIGLPQVSSLNRKPFTMTPNNLLESAGYLPLMLDSWWQGTCCCTATGQWSKLLVARMPLH